MYNFAERKNHVYDMTSEKSCTFPVRRINITYAGRKTHKFAQHKNHVYDVTSENSCKFPVHKIKHYKCRQENV